MLTPAEWRTVNAIRHGMTTRRIAQHQGVSIDAVKFHLANALAKLGLANRAALRSWRGVPANSLLTKSSPQTKTNGAAPMPTDADGGQLQLGPIGQISRQVRDFEVTVDWYQKVLGLPHLYTFGQLAFFDCGGTRLMLSPPEPEPAPAPGAASKAPDPGEPSLLYFRVTDIQRAYDELIARGIHFRGAPHLIHRHDSGVEEWMAFFDDPEGHPLAIMSQVQP